MRLITDIKKEEKSISAALLKYGSSVEHHFSHYLATETPTENLLFLSFPGKCGVLMSRKGDVWSIFPEGVLAPDKDRLSLLEKALAFALSRKKGKKVVLEVGEKFRSEIISWIKSSKRYRAAATNFILHWPVFDMASFDASLFGKKWKKMRNIRNRFKKQHRVKVVDSKSVPLEKLNAIVYEWLRKRKHSDVVKKEYYYNLINSRFRGFALAKTILIDGEPCTITAGWRVPNGSKHYYSAVGIFNYRHKGLGEFANLVDLLLLKRKGYRIVDFGGSDKSLLTFKNKFRPTSLYKTYTFSIVRKR